MAREDRWKFYQFTIWQSIIGEKQRQPVDVQINGFKDKFRSISKKEQSEEFFTILKNPIGDVVESSKDLKIKEHLQSLNRTRNKQPTEKEIAAVNSPFVKDLDLAIDDQSSNNNCSDEKRSLRNSYT